MTILVTGTAGFIGYHTAEALLQRGETVIGVDNINDYYDPQLKRARLERLQPHERFSFHQIDVAKRDDLARVFDAHPIDRVIHLAAQAGVRYSIENPSAYIDANLVGFSNILEACRHADVRHLAYASSSSVYGANRALPFSVHDNVDHPLSLYAATKKSNELMAHAYAHLFNLPVTGLRFFTVYGPWGRPDMALFLFTKNILAGRPIDVFNNGNHARDFTYIDDIVEGVIRVLDRPPAGDPNWQGEAPDPATSRAPYRVYNIGNNAPVELMHFIACIEQAVGRKAELNMLPLQPGDVEKTYADIEALTRDTGFRPATSIEDGIARFVKWYRAYYDA
ncbi:MAG: NAD-dependent epimerase [Pseudomonadota bacterium]